MTADRGSRAGGCDAEPSGTRECVPEGSAFGLPATGRGQPSSVIRQRLLRRDLTDHRRRRRTPLDAVHGREDALVAHGREARNADLERVAGRRRDVLVEQREGALEVLATDDPGLTAGAGTDEGELVAGHLVISESCGEPSERRAHSG